MYTIAYHIVLYHTGIGRESTMTIRTHKNPEEYHNPIYGSGTPNMDDVIRRQKHDASHLEPDEAMGTVVDEVVICDEAI